MGVAKMIEVIQGYCVGMAILLALIQDERTSFSRWQTCALFLIGAALWHRP